MQASSNRGSLLESWPAIVALAVVLTLYRIWLVNHIGFTVFYDEAQYWDWSRQLAWGYYSKPPMIAALIKLSTSVFGDGVAGVKLSSMLLYPAAAAFVGLLAREFNPRAGVTAAALFLCMPITSLMGLFTTTDAPLLLFWAVASWALWRAQTTDRLAWWAAVGLACGLGLLSKYTMAAFGISALAVLWLVPGPRTGLTRFGPWLSVALAVAVLSPNLMWNAANDFPTLKHTADITTRAHRSGGVKEALEFLVGQALLLGPLGAWWAWRGLRGVGRADTKDGVAAPQGARAFLLLLTLPLIALAVAQAVKAHAHLNWAAPALVGLVVLSALALHTPAGEQRGKALKWVLVSNLVLAAIVAHAGDIAHVAGRPLPSRLDAFVRMRGWDQAFAQVRGQIPALSQPAGPIALPTVLAEDRVLLTQSAYQWRDLNVHPVAWNPRGGMEDHYELTTKLRPEPGRQWLLLTQTGDVGDITARFEHSQPAGQARIEVAPGRFIELHATLLSGFKGYAPR